jgi:membrane-bound metal-dependent hydrolase YbcI (DUF457 family)
MAYAVTHVLVPIVLLDLLRHYYFNAKQFPRYLIVIGGIAGLVPDIDIPLSWLYSLMTNTSIDLHGLYTHSLFSPILFVFVAIYFDYIGKAKWRNIFYVIAFGWFIHILVDWSYGGYKALFWPFFYTSPGLFPPWQIWEYGASIDAILLTLWIVHEEIHNHIRDYF